MTYDVGMFGGSFDPLHVGHIHDVIRAAAMCRELYVILSWCEGRESTPRQLRYRWLRSSFRHLPNVKILLLEDKAVSKEVYNTGHYWQQGAADIRRLIGKPIDIVFCGSDYRGTGRFEALYPECVIHYFDRREVPISSTEIRGWAFRHWDYIPAVCRDHYAARVLIVGGESTGKSTLTENLALAYNTNFVGEAGRETCDRAGGEDMMVASDLHETFLLQRLRVMEGARQANRILFVDTDALTTLFYCEFLLGQEDGALEHCRQLAEGIHHMSRWDLVLFLEPDVPFVQDGTRSETIRAQREACSRQLKSFFDRYGVPCESLRGSYLERFDGAKQLIGEKLGITTQW